MKTRAYLLLFFCLIIFLSCVNKQRFRDLSPQKASRFLSYITTEPWYGSFNDVIELIDKGANIEHIDKNELYKNTPFLNAAGAIEIARMLKHEDCSKGKIDSMETEAIKIVKYLVKKGVNVKACEPIQQLNALHQAAIGGRERMIPLLVSYGLDINCRDKSSGTPLIHAIGSGDLATVKAIVEAGADINLCTKDGNSPYDFALATSKSPEKRHYAYYKDIDAIVAYLEILGAKHGKNEYKGSLYLGND